MSYRRKHIKPKIRSLKKKEFIKKSLISIFLFLFIAVMILYFILFFSKFQVQKVDILGDEKNKSQDIKNLVWLDINKKIFSLGVFDISTKSIFMVDSKKIVKDILDKFPSIEDVKVQKKMPDKIVLNVKERKPFAIFCQSDNCFFIDESGVIFEPLHNNIIKDMTIIQKDLDGKELFVGKNVIEKNIIDTIYKVQKDLKDNFQIDIKEVFVSNYLIFKTSENWQIYFNSNSDVDLQITKMNILLRDEIPVSVRKNIQYIYLQYKDRAYYK